MSSYRSGCELIGSLGVKTKSPPPNFAPFCDFLNCLDLIASNTWIDKSQYDYAIQPCTYVDKRGGQLVIDYLLHSQNV